MTEQEIIKLQEDNERLKRLNTLYEKDKRIFQGKIEILAHFVKHTKTDYDSLLSDFISDKSDTDKKFYTEIYKELAKFNLF